MKKRYVINRGDSTVVAMLENGERVTTIGDEVGKYASSNTRDLIHGFLYETAFYDNYDIDISPRPKFRGVAKCDPRDNFDVEVGKTIAATKYDLKYHKTMQKKYKKLIRILNQAIIDLEKLLKRHEYKILAIEKSLDKRFGQDVA